MINEAVYYSINRLYDSFVTQTPARGRYFFMLDIVNDVARWSPEAVTEFALEGEFVHKLSEVLSQLLAANDAVEFASDRMAFAAGRLEKKDTTWRIRGRDGNFIPCAVKCYAVKDYAGKPAYLAAALTGKGVESHTDPTTGLPDQVRFLEYLRELFYADRKAVVLFTGTSGLSEINSLYGYTWGNRVISSLAEHLSYLAGNNGRIFRGEGAMLIFCTDAMSSAEVRRLYSGLRSYAEHMLIIDSVRVSMRIGGGIVVADDPEIDVHAILACAKFAESHSETETEGEPVILKNDYLNKNAKTLELVNAIHSDVEHGCQNFSLYYQPILDARDDTLLGSAAFLRWQREPFASISPAEFLKWFEKDPSFKRLGNWILERAIKEGRDFLKADPSLILNINLAQRQLEQQEFHSFLLTLLKESGFPGKNLCLELTDRCRLLDLEFLKNEVIYLKACGIKVALDGSCLLDLRLLRELPVDIIKTGRDFIAGVMRNDKDRALFKAICSFASQSGIKVCAEGVETKETLDLVRDYGIYAYQGYISSAPVPFERFWKFMP